MGIDLGQLQFVAEIIIKTHHLPGTCVASQAEQWALDCDLASCSTSTVRRFVRSTLTSPTTCSGLDVRPL